VLLRAGSPDLVRIEALVAQHLVDPPTVALAQASTGRDVAANMPFGS
jgi:hypothetical protein